MHLVAKYWSKLLFLPFFYFSDAGVGPQDDHNLPVVEHGHRVVQPLNVPDALTSTANLEAIKTVGITSIRATDVSLGLRRIPVGFHVTVQADGAKWQTTNKVVHIDQAVVEWNERIPLPLEPSSKVWFRVYASFESSPMLGQGEPLRTFEISVGELLDRSERACPFTFQPKVGDVVSPCTSLFITVEQRNLHEDDAAVPYPITPSTSSEMPT
ncbi:uncharacterized protein EDB91DRAFT_740853 [Suillus paluster]|uniref:uncharacterized protein n=1 Tax=Suillus paluster TaxID=48578 RepID=UPI001B85C8BE|nr:uncharacterized protein EDB91DRAFT_740853 [Suillus paluster]KAG1730805.1 hypothetical protein EDB91DRAFT_740853 [Suillus paluster]